ncbi:hypothetical protein [Gorillibacterium timonense]|uniref:hypothetical protein n=1 Tax=Gorillibacterium timonense TaxID=1689269 RepID=UPI001652A5CF|nr:hypothetical protein [Gorillibacterium timonense]
MRTKLLRTRLSLDDYLDMLNLAIRLGDKEWQKEITAKLEELTSHQTEAGA